MVVEKENTEEELFYDSAYQGLYYVFFVDCFIPFSPQNSSIQIFFLIF